jgi:membrane-associated protease RseP (regulator of RpoE activity)
MKGFQILLILCLIFCARFSFAQSTEKTYEITITLTDAEGKKEVKEMLIKGDMSQEELDAMIQEKIGGAYEEIDVNVNVNVDGRGSSNAVGKESKTITKIIKQRNNLSEEEKIIIEEQDMEIEVIDDKVYINGEEVEDGDFGDKKVRILKFEEGEDFDLEGLLEGEDIKIGEGEKIFFIEREESSEGIAFLGITAEVPVEDGLPIGSIVEGSSAEDMGLLVGDIIVSIDGKKVDSFETLSKVVKTYLPGEKVNLVYLRDGVTNDVDIELSDYDKFVTGRNVWVERQRRHGPHVRHRVKKMDDNKPSLGVILKGSDSDEVVINEVLVGSAAEKAGLQAGDKITKIDKAEVLGIDHAIATIKGHKVGDEIKLKVVRAGKNKTLRATLQKPARMDGRPGNNTSNTIERIIIKKSDKEDNRANFETGGAIKIRNFDLSPNPSQGEVNVQFSMDPLQVGEELYIRIISLDGKVIEEMVLDAFDCNFSKSFDLNDKASGIYLFQAEKNKQKFTKRFVLKQN